MPNSNCPKELSISQPFFEPPGTLVLTPHYQRKAAPGSLLKSILKAIDVTHALPCLPYESKTEKTMDLAYSENPVSVLENIKKQEWILSCLRAMLQRF